MWLCRCECGNEVIRIAGKLAGHTGMPHCGCRGMEEASKARRTHGRYEAERDSKQWIVLEMWKNARNRAARKGIAFTIAVEDIIIPDTCPIFDIPLIRGTKTLTDNSPSLERVDNERGYVPGNVLVVSYKANRMKSNGSLAELRRLVMFYESL